MAYEGNYHHVAREGHKNQISWLYKSSNHQKTESNPAELEKKNLFLVVCFRCLACVWGIGFDYGTKTIIIIIVFKLYDMHYVLYQCS